MFAEPGTESDSSKGDTGHSSLEQPVYVEIPEIKGEQKEKSPESKKHFSGDWPNTSPEVVSSKSSSEDENENQILDETRTNNSESEESVETGTFQNNFSIHQNGSMSEDDSYSGKEEESGQLKLKAGCLNISSSDDDGHDRKRGVFSMNINSNPHLDSDNTNGNINPYNDQNVGISYSQGRRSHEINRAYNQYTDSDPTTSDEYSSSSSGTDNSYINNDNDIVNEKSSIPSIHEQHQIIEELEEKYNSFVVGENVFAMPSYWYNNWKNAENSRFLYTINTKGMYDIERQSLDQSRYDIKIVTKPVWEKFKEWYGGEDVPLPVFEHPDTKKPTVLMKSVKVIVIYKEEEKIFYYNEIEKVIDFKRRALKKFGIDFLEGKVEESSVEQNENNAVPLLSEFRIVDYYRKTARGALKDNSLMSENNIINENELLLDYKLESGKFYSDTLDTYNGSSYVTNYSPMNQGYYGINYNYGNSNYLNTQYYGQPLGPGKVGLQNLGNTCFFNSGVQCLMHTMPIVQILLGTDWEQDINTTNPLGMRGKLVRAFQSLLKQMWDGQSRVIAPHELKSVIGEFATQFAGWGQQDSHELITFLLDGINEDLNRCREKPYVETVIGSDANEEETAKESWMNHKKRNDSIIVDNFHGQLRSKLYCPDCQQTTVVFDPFMTISLPISKPNQTTLNITFVPYEFIQPWIKTTIVVPLSSSNADYSREISSKIGKNVNVLVATYYHSSHSFEWGIKESSGMYYSSVYLAYEIPDTSSVYVPCVIQINTKWNNSYNYSANEVVGTPFLLPVPKEIALSEKEYESLVDSQKDECKKAAVQILEEAAEKYLSCCWNPPDNPKETDEVLEQVNKSLPYKKCKIKEEHKIGVKIRKIYYQDPKILVVDGECPYITKNSAFIFISDEHRTKECGFSFASLMRHLNEISHNNDDSDKDSETDIISCFEYFSAQEVLDEDNRWFCPRCRKFVCANKKMDIWSVPRCLVIHLKRFSIGEYSSNKDERNVIYPDEIDIDRFVVGHKNIAAKFRLYAVSEHMGGLGGGHYTSHAVVVDKNNNGEWYYFNDSSCSPSSSKNAHNSSAYVLFYQLIEDNCPQITDGNPEASD